ncbi:unnamed protein product [Mytilus coruscus]|uniref:IgGFc-binding protein N-terminal domain-containing protein n=1 Tax=Mytilus coruscus TaxID=42192 RepID=A0A6J8B6Z4_MYTCO|nr:unnamed protein product [Mytilus coruscus]
MALTKGCVRALLISYGSIGYLKTAYSPYSTETQYVPLLNKVKTPVMAEIDLSMLGEQLKSFMKIEIEKVITEKIALESTKMYNKLENNFNSATENFTTSMEYYTDGVLHNTSISMRMDIAQKLNNTFTRHVRRFRTIVHSNIRSNLQSVKRQIDSVLLQSYNKSNACYPDRKMFRKLSGKFKELSKQLNDLSDNRNGGTKKLNYAKGHKGKLFFTMFPIQLENRRNIFAQFIITTDRQTKVDFLSEYADINRTVVIKTGVAYIDIPSSALMLGIGRTYATVLIRADQLITVVGFFKNKQSGSSGFIFLPFNVLGKDYSLITQPGNNQHCGIIATDTNTTVVIESATERSISVGGETIEPGQKFNMVLDYLEGFHVQTKKNLFATKISANKQIVIISGNRYTSIQSNSYCYQSCEYHSDIVYESMIPADKWGRHFVIPLIHKASRLEIRMVSRNENTTVTIKSSRGYSYTRKGDPIEIDLSSDSYFVSASHPILLSLYTLVETKGIIMMIVPGIEQYSKEYVIAPPKDTSYTNYITVTIKTADIDGLRFVGNLLDVESTVIKARNESFSSVVKKMTSHSVYKIRHVSTNALYGVVVYGFGASSAYGYSAGFRL